MSARRFANIPPLAQSDTTAFRSCKAYRICVQDGVVHVRLLRERSEGRTQTSSTVACVSYENIPPQKGALLRGIGFVDEDQLFLKKITNENDELGALFRVFDRDFRTIDEPNPLLPTDLTETETLEFRRGIGRHTRLAFGYNYDPSSAFPWALAVSYWQHEPERDVIAALDKLPFAFTRKELPHSGEVCTLFEKRMRTYASLLRAATRASEEVIAASERYGLARNE